MMYHYKIHGMLVISDFPLDAAFPVDPFDIEESDIWIHSGDVPERILTGSADETMPYYSAYYHTQGWVRVTGHGGFLIPSHREIIYRLKDRHNPILIAEIILCFCLGIIAVLKGRLMLHGSGMLWGDKAVIISGNPGAGKSTLAGAILRSGGVFMADDSVMISLDEGGIWANPGYPQQKLCKDAAVAYQLDISKLILLPTNEGEPGEEKYAVRLKEGYCDTRQPLGVIVYLEKDDNAREGSISLLSGSGATKCFTENLYRQNAYKAFGFTRSVFMDIVRIINNVPVYKLVRPTKGLSIEDELALVREALSSSF